MLSVKKIKIQNQGSGGENIMNTNTLEDAIDTYIVDLECEKDFDLTENEAAVATTHYLFSLTLEREVFLMSYKELLKYL